MKILSLHIQGLASLPTVSITEPQMFEGLSGPNLQTEGLAQALEFAFCAFNATALQHLLWRWKWVSDPDDVEVSVEDFPVQCRWPIARQNWLVGTGVNRLSIALELKLSAAQLGDIRARVGGDPQVLQALMQSSSLSFRVTALMTRSMDVFAIHYSDVAIGDFQVQKNKLPKYLHHFFHRLHLSFFRLPIQWNVADVAVDKLLSASQFFQYENFVQALVDQHAIRAAKDEHGQAVLLDGESPLRVFGPQAMQRACQAGAFYLTEAAIVWIDGPLLLARPQGIQVWNPSATGQRIVEAKNKSKALRFGKINRG